MGFSTGCTCSNSKPPVILKDIISRRLSSILTTTLNPDIRKFKIIQYIKCGKYLMVRIRYKNCLSFKGDKILVFENISIKKLKKCDIIDPHFLEEGLSPIARFRPTKDGWKIGKQLISTLTNTNIKELKCLSL